MLKSTKVSDYMSRNLVTFHPETEFFAAIKTLLKHQISGAPVTNADGQLVGMLSELDCIRSILSDSYYDYENLGGVVGEYMTHPVETVRAEDDITDVAKRFIESGRRRLPVMDGDELIGQISRKDVLQAIHDLVTSKR